MLDPWIKKKKNRSSYQLFDHSVQTLSSHSFTKQCVGTVFLSTQTCLHSTPLKTLPPQVNSKEKGNHAKFPFTTFTCAEGAWSLDWASKWEVYHPDSPLYSLIWVWIHRFQCQLPISFVMLLYVSSEYIVLYVFPRSKLIPCSCKVPPNWWNSIVNVLFCRIVIDLRDLNCH